MQRLSVFAFLIYGALSLGSDTSAHGAEPAPEHKVVVTIPLIRDLVVTRRYHGKVIDPGLHEVRPYAPGIITEIAVKDGQTVKEGELIFQIDRAPYEINLKAATAKRLAVEDDYAVAKKAAANEDVAAQVEEQFKLPLLEARGREAVAANELDGTTVRARFDGIVERVNEKVGSQVQEKTVVAVMSAPGIVWIELEVTDSDYLDYWTGVQKTVPELAPVKPGDKPLLGKIQGFIPDFRSLGFITARARFSNLDGALQLGKIVTVTLRTTIKDAVLIPRRAANYNTDTHGQVVFVVGSDGKARQRKVDLSFEKDDFALVRGLKPEEKIIIYGFRDLKDGDPVQTETRPAEELFTTYEHHPPK